MPKGKFFDLLQKFYAMEINYMRHTLEYAFFSLQKVNSRTTKDVIADLQILRN